MRRSRLIAVASLACLLTVAGRHPRAATEDLSQAGSTAHETVHVWRVGSPHRGDVPDGMIPVDLGRAASALGVTLEMRVLAAKDLSDAFHAARATNDEPDILVIDNMGLIRGITTALGRFDGIGAEASLVKVSESLQSFAPASWEFLLRTSRHHAAAKALATRSIDCAAGAEIGAGGNALTKVAETAAVGYARRDQSILDNLVGGPYLADSLEFDRDPQSVSDVRVCGQWGNERLAFAITTIAFDGQEELGYRSLLTIVGSDDGRARLFEIAPSSTIVDVLRREAPPLNDGPPSSIAAPVVSQPEDGASSLRLPKERRPDLTWTSANHGACFYVVEWQFGQNGVDRHWRGGGFAVVHSTAGTNAVTVKAPFGVGQQPHRWRVWAIDDRGAAARSDWRILNYLN